MLQANIFLLENSFSMIQANIFLIESSLSNVTTIHRDYPENRAKDASARMLRPALLQTRVSHTDSGMGGDKGPMGGDLRVIHEKIWRYLKLARNVHDKG